MINKTITRSDFTYEVGALDPELAFDLFVDLFGSLGPAFGALLGAVDGAGEDAMFIQGGFKEAIERLAVTLDKAKMKKAMAAFAAVTKVSDSTGKTLGMLSSMYQLHFTGRFADQMSLFIFCAGAQYSDFFVSFKSDLMKLKAGQPL